MNILRYRCGDGNVTASALNRRKINKLIKKKIADNVPEKVKQYTSVFLSTYVVAQFMDTHIHAFLIRGLRADAWHGRVTRGMEHEHVAWENGM